MRLSAGDQLKKLAFQLIYRKGRFAQGRARDRAIASRYEDRELADGITDEPNALDLLWIVPHFA